MLFLQLYKVWNNFLNKCLTYLKIVKIGSQEFIFNILHFFMFVVQILFIYAENLLIFFFGIWHKLQIPYFFLITWYCKDFLFQYFISNAKSVVYSRVYNINIKIFEIIENYISRREISSY